MYVYMYVGEVGMKRVASEISRQSTNEDDEGLCLQHAYMYTYMYTYITCLIVLWVWVRSRVRV
jgi:hypothetical protein